MRINEYTSLQAFCQEYDENRYNNEVEKHIGLEFIFNQVYYRMCREPLNENELPILNDGKKAKFDVNIVHWKNGFGSDFTYELVGWYSCLEDVLDDCIIQGKSFRDIIMDDSTEIIGKD
jgi:hypothetical protein